jgi:hypothetical protein
MAQRQTRHMLENADGQAGKDGVERSGHRFFEVRWGGRWGTLGGISRLEHPGPPYQNSTKNRHIAY